MNTAQTIASTGFDIFNLTAPAVRVTKKVDLVYDDEGNATAGFIIVGKDSPEYRNESHAIRTEGTKRSAVLKKQIDTKTDAGAGQLIDLVDNNTQRLAVAVVVGWYGYTNNGVEVPLDKALVKAAYDKFSTWEVKVMAALEVDSDFLPPLSEASLTTPSTASSD